MKKFILCVFLFWSGFCYAGACSSLDYEKISDYLKKTIPSLSWVDINTSADCQFVIRYYLCNKSTQEEINKNLGKAIQDSSKLCILVSHGKHIHTEGYCTLTDVIAHCGK